MSVWSGAWYTGRQYGDHAINKDGADTRAGREVSETRGEMSKHRTDDYMIT